MCSVGPCLGGQPLGSSFKRWGSAKTFHLIALASCGAARPRRRCIFGPFLTRPSNQYGSGEAQEAAGCGRAEQNSEGQQEWLNCSQGFPDSLLIQCQPAVCCLVWAVPKHLHPGHQLRMLVATCLLWNKRFRIFVDLPRQNVQFTRSDSSNLDSD